MYFPLSILYAMRYACKFLRKAKSEATHTAAAFWASTHSAKTSLQCATTHLFEQYSSSHSGLLTAFAAHPCLMQTFPVVSNSDAGAVVIGTGLASSSSDLDISADFAEAAAAAAAAALTGLDLTTVAGGREAGVDFGAGKSC